MLQKRGRRFCDDFRLTRLQLETRFGETNYLEFVCGMGLGAPKRVKGPRYPENKFAKNTLHLS